MPIAFVFLALPVLCQGAKTEDNVISLPSSPLPYNPLSWALQLVTERECTLKGKEMCKFQGTPGSDKGNLAWNCPAGSYCLAQGLQFPCTGGFYCPENTAIPIYCPPGYMCSADAKKLRLCPAGFYCPIGTVEDNALSCFHNILANCPEGSSSASKFGIAVGFLGAFALLKFIFNRKANIDALISKKHQEELKLVNNVRFADKMQLEKLKHTFDIDFEDIGLTLPNGTQILSGINGRLQSGHAMAIMGPSGSGKTTFMTLLIGKVSRTKGNIYINGKSEEIRKYSRLIGYVPQEDIMLRELTVRDVLMHSARTRLPCDWDYHKVKAKVLEIISFLGMSAVANTVIGNEEERGISGGQRKRVNIGMELVAEPSLLFLDEPTSGLDSSTAFEVCENLKNIAEQKGLTVAAVIHSPSISAFNQFHDFMLLGKGGKLVYIGPRDFSQSYFHKIGFTLPPNESPSDFYMDVVTGKIASEFDPGFDPRKLPDYWIEYSETGNFNTFDHLRRMSPDQAIEAKRRFLKTHSTLHDLHSRKNLSKNWIISVTQGIGTFFYDWIAFFLDVFKELTSSFSVTAQSRQIQPFPMQFWLLTRRALMQRFKTSGAFMMELILNFLIGSFISVAVQNFGYQGKLPKEICAYLPYIMGPKCNEPMDLLKQAGMFISVGAIFSGTTAGLNTFGREKLVFWRDVSTGMSTLAYFLAKLIVDIPKIIIGSLFFTISLIIFFPYSQPFGYLALNVMVLYFCSFAMGYWISSAFDMARAGLVGVGFALLWALVISGGII